MSAYPNPPSQMAGRPPTSSSRNVPLHKKTIAAAAFAGVVAFAHCIVPLL